MKNIALSLLLTGLLWPLSALTAPQEPLQLAREVTQSLEQKIQPRKQEFKKNPQKLYELVDKEVLPLFDFRYMSQLVLGRAWRQATPEQRDRFTQSFKALLVKTYADVVLDYSGEDIQWLPVKAPDDAKDITLRSRVDLNSGEQAALDYSLHKRDGRWQVYNITVENVSLVTNYRGQFSSKVKREGLDTLIKEMEAKYGSGV